jgi:arylsulfatase A
VPVIGSDIFSTVLGIVGIDLPKDRTIDGVDIRPAFDGQPLKRPVPLFWRTHIAPEKSHAAMRIGDWKIVADKTLTEFQLFEIAKDWKEEHDVAADHPERLAEMKAKFMEVWRGIEAEGPREWWENEPEKKPRPKNQRGRTKGAKLSDGKDETGKWPLVLGGTMTKAPAGFVLEGEAEAIALRPLDPPLTGDGKAIFKLEYQSAAIVATRNAMFCFGAKPTNDALVKAGTAIGMGEHVVFDGGWGKVGSLGAAKGHFEVDDRFYATVTVDLGKRECVLKVGDKTLRGALPESLGEVRYYGVYTKATASAFSEIEVSR